MQQTTLEFNLQFFKSRSPAGEGLGMGGGKSIDIKNETDVWSYRHNKNNEPFVDAINTGVRTIENDFPGLMDTVNYVNAAELGGADKTQTLGFYGNGRMALNQNYTNIDKMNNVYDASVKSGHHPSRGNKSGTEAVALHEMGHALTDHLKGKLQARNLDFASKKIVEGAYKNIKAKGGTKAFAQSISGYATESFAECVAEAVADYYCNGSKAHANSKAIVSFMKSL